MRHLIWILCILVIFCEYSCRTIEYIPVEVVKTDTTYINKIQRDSIYKLDSIYILDRGDTVLITQTKYLFRDKLIRDTIYSSKIDSVQVPYPVKRTLTQWEQIQLYISKLTIGGIIIAIIIYFVKKYKT